MALRPAVIRDQDRIDVRLTGEDEYRIPFTFIEALNEGTLFDRPAHAFLDAARERRLFHVLNRTTDNIIGTGIIQSASGDERSAKQAEVGGLMFHPAARGFGLCSLLVKIMMVYAIKESGRDSPDEEYLAHVVDGNGAPLHSLLEAGFRPIGLSLMAYIIIIFTKSDANPECRFAYHHGRLPRSAPPAPATMPRPSRQ